MIFIQVFVGRIPRTVYEDELVPLLEKAGTIWDFRLMMDPLSGQNRGFGFVSYTNKECAAECVKLVGLEFFCAFYVFTALQNLLIFNYIVLHMLHD